MRHGCREPGRPRRTGSWPLSTGSRAWLNDPDLGRGFSTIRLGHRRSRHAVGHSANWLSRIDVDRRRPAAPLVLLRSRDAFVIGDPLLAPLGPARLYGVDVPAMSFQLHEWDIHIE